MSDARLRTLLILCVLLMVGGAVGWLASPWLARTNYIVEVAERVWLEESGVVTGEVITSEAFRRTGGIPLEQLYADANRIKQKFRMGSTLLGVFLGLVIGLKALGLVIEPQREEYEADPALCLACARCYEACPVEHERRGTVLPAVALESAAATIPEEPAPDA